MGFRAYRVGGHCESGSVGGGGNSEGLMKKCPFLFCPRYRLVGMCGPQGLQ